MKEEIFTLVMSAGKPMLRLVPCVLIIFQTYYTITGLMLHNPADLCYKTDK
jgi:hypothetical protein